MIDLGPSNFRKQKVSSVISRALSQLFLREYRGLDGFVVSVSYVNVADNMKEATVFVVISGTDTDRNSIVQELNDTSSIIRRLLFKYLELRYVPRLHFKLDVGFDNLVSIRDILQRSE